MFKKRVSFGEINNWIDKVISLKCSKFVCNFGSIAHLLELSATLGRLGVITSSKMFTTDVSVWNRGLFWMLLQSLVKCVTTGHLIHFDSFEFDSCLLQNCLSLITEWAVGLGEHHHFVLFDIFFNFVKWGISCFHLPKIN